MPTTYTHDVFGKMVYQKLPENLKEIVEEHTNAYRIGQHGPDILFYYHLFHENPVNQKGMAMHEQIAASFFRKCKEYCQETGDEEALAYVLDLSAIICWTVRVIPILQNTWRRPGQGMMRSKRSWIVI